MSPDVIARIVPHISATPDPALPLALEWAGDDESRWDMDVLAAFVALVHACDQAQREKGGEP